MLYIAERIETADFDGLLVTLVNLICTRHVHWNPAVQATHSTHIIDFGPGYSSGIGSLTFRNLEGRGVQVAFAGCTLIIRYILLDPLIRRQTRLMEWISSAMKKGQLDLELTGERSLCLA